MKVYAVLAALFATAAVALPNNVEAVPTRVIRRDDGEQFCECIDDCQNECAGSGCEGGLGLAFCESGCYDYPTPTASTCEQMGY